MIAETFYQTPTYFLTQFLIFCTDYLSRSLVTLPSLFVTVKPNVLYAENEQALYFWSLGLEPEISRIALLVYFKPDI